MATGVRPKWYYRYIDFHGKDVTNFTVLLWEFKVVKRTKHGVWIEASHYTDKKRFILDGSGKRFAHATKEEALHALKKRKQRQHSILSRQMAHVEAVLAAFKAGEMTVDTAEKKHSTLFSFGTGLD